MIYILLAYITWIHYLALMHLKKVRDAGKLNKLTKTLAYPVLVMGLLSDVLFQVASSVPFLEVPKEILYTGRVTRHLKNNDQSTWLSRWRYNLSYFSCRYLLDPFEDGGHCK